MHVKSSLDVKVVYRIYISKLCGSKKELKGDDEEGDGMR